MRYANAVMLILFVSWAAFQYNDPDVLLWLVVYGAAAVECVLFYMGRLPRLLGQAYALLCLVWGLYLAVRVVLAGEFFFDEQGREMLGLFVCAGWSYVLLRRTHSGGRHRSA